MIFNCISNLKKRKSNKTPFLIYCLGILILYSLVFSGCSKQSNDHSTNPKISLVNSPTDIVTVGASWLVEEIVKKSAGEIEPILYHSGVLSGGKGLAEIEMCQQGSIQIHITSTAYLSNLTPKASIVSLPFLFRDIDQVISLVQSNSQALQEINEELNAKNLAIIAWWPRGFRQLTNSKRPVKSIEDLQGLKFRVMNNQLFVDNMNAMGANPVPMEWGEVYNALQLRTIDGQENAEDVIYSSKLYEIQPYMTVWDYSTDLEVVLVNYQWWQALPDRIKSLIQESADASVPFQISLLEKNTKVLREKIAQSGVDIYYMPLADKQVFKDAVQSVWEKYREVFGSSFMTEFLNELKDN